MKRLLIACVLNAVYLTGSTALADPARQVSLSVGVSQQDQGGLTPALTGKGYSNVTASADKQDSAWKLEYQHPLNARWSTNVAYVDLGRSTATVSATLPAGKSNSTAAQEIADSLPKRGKGITASALYHTPLKGKWDANLGLGAYAYQDERSATVSGTKQTVEKSGVVALTHAGISYPVSPNVSLQGEWEHYFMDEAVDYVGLGIAYSF